MPKCSAWVIAPIIPGLAIVLVTARKNCHRDKYQNDNCDNFQEGIFHNYILVPDYAVDNDDDDAATAP